MTSTVNSYPRAALSKPNNNQRIIMAVILLFAWIMFGLNCANADYSNYEYAFNEIKAGHSNSYLDIGFAFFMYIVAKLNLSYQGFLIITAAVCLILFLLAVRHLTQSINATLILYVIYPFVFDIVQYRNFLAFAIVLYGLRFLLREKVGCREIVLYLLHVAIGMLFHSSVMLYALFALVAVKDNKAFISFVVALFVIFTFLIVNGSILNNLFLFFHLDRFAKYTIDYAYTTFVQYLAVYLLFIFLAALKFRNNVNSKKFRLLIVASLFLPFIIMNGTSARFIRNVFVLFYAFLLDLKGKKFAMMNERQMFIHLAVFATVLFVFYAQLSSGLYHDIVLMPILQNNLLFRK